LKGLGSRDLLLDAGQGVALHGGGLAVSHTDPGRDGVLALPDEGSGGVAAGGKLHDVLGVLFVVKAGVVKSVEELLEVRHVSGC